jgi:hypothetical protein
MSILRIIICNVNKTYKINKVESKLKIGTYFFFLNWSSVPLRINHFAVKCELKNRVF